MDNGGRPGPGSDGELVELEIPALPELLSLPRLTAAAVAARIGFDVDEVEDTRLAVEELCLAVSEGRGPGRLCIRLTAREGGIEVECTFESDGGAAVAGNFRGRLATELSGQLLDALVDEHGSDVESGVLRAWLRKSRGHRVE